MTSIPPIKVGNYLSEFVSETAPILTKAADAGNEAVDDAYKYVSNSMMAGVPAPKPENTVDEMVGKIINYFG